MVTVFSDAKEDPVGRLKLKLSREVGWLATWSLEKLNAEEPCNGLPLSSDVPGVDSYQHITIVIIIAKLFVLCIWLVPSPPPSIPNKLPQASHWAHQASNIQCIYIQHNTVSASAHTWARHRSANIELFLTIRSILLFSSGQRSPSSSYHTHARTHTHMHAHTHTHNFLNPVWNLNVSKLSKVSKYDWIRHTWNIKKFCGVLLILLFFFPKKGSLSR